MSVIRSSQFSAAVWCFTALLLCGSVVAETSPAETPLAEAASSDAGASPKPGALDSTGLGRVSIAGPGMVLVHPSISIGTYDAVRYGGVQITYKDGQKRLSEKREQQLREKILERFEQSSADSGTIIATEEEACVVDVHLAVLNVDLQGKAKGKRKRSGNKTFKISLGSATFVIDLRDSINDERLALLAGRRDFGPGEDRGGSLDDFRRLSDNVGMLMVALGESLGVVVADELLGREGAEAEENPNCSAKLREAALRSREAAARAE